MCFLTYNLDKRVASKIPPTMMKTMTIVTIRVKSFFLFFFAFALAEATLKTPLSGKPGCIIA
jgi:hypothetical protein